jgi:hypothetical protein
MKRQRSNSNRKADRKFTISILGIFRYEAINPSNVDFRMTVVITILFMLFFILIRSKL